MERMITKVIEVLQYVLGIVLLAMVGLSVWNVLARYVLNSAILWADEVAIFGMIFITWLGAIIVAWRGADISMDLLVEMLPPAVQGALRRARQLIIAIMCSWVAWLSWQFVQKLFQFGMVSDAARLPSWTINAVVTVSLICIASIALWRGFRPTPEIQKTRTDQAPTS